MSYTQDAKPNWPATLQVSVVLTAKSRTVAAAYRITKYIIFVRINCSFKNKKFKKNIHYTLQ